MKTKIFAPLILGLSLLLHSSSLGQNFTHPGINQTAQDLAFMKQQVLQGVEPYKGAFERLKATTSLDFLVTPFTHVLRGSYGKPNIGGNDLSKGANMAYNCAIIWYITGEKAYADKSLEIVRAWSATLWDFDYNDAKLLAAWTGHLFCNAAEILRYTPGSGWEAQDTGQFSQMLTTVYYPLLRYYFPQANGNWDGAIIHTLLATAVFTDNRAMFDNAIDHLVHGPVNGSLFKYIYPSGECQESARDQAHVQLGLGEFVGAGQIAFTQGVDVFSMADNRLALGYEYTAGFLLGKIPHCYGIISERAKTLRDDYEYVYRHYAAQGIELTNTRIAADSVRPLASRSVLSSVRKSFSIPQKKQTVPQASTIGYIAGALAVRERNVPEDAVRVMPGESIQDALNSIAGTGKWVVATGGLHTLPTTLKIPSGVTLAGEGVGTILFLDPASGVRDALVNASENMHDVTLRDFVLEGAIGSQPGTDPNSSRSFRSNANRGGILFVSPTENGMKKLSFLNLTVRNFTFNGVFIAGVSEVLVQSCDFNENGGSVVPGPKLQHNLLLRHCQKVEIEGCRLVTSPHGSGLVLDHSSEVIVTNSEIARNAHYGVLITESSKVSLTSSLIEANDRSGVLVEYLYHGSDGVVVKNNTIQYNNGYGVESYALKNGEISKNTYEGNLHVKTPEKISREGKILMN
jgi:hypothetical protein